MKRFAFSAILILALIMTACGGTAMPSAAADYAGRDHGLVKSELERAGFKDIEETVLKDLTSARIREDGAVESVSVNGKTDFAAGAKFSPSAKIVITYHALLRIAFPLTDADVQAQSAESLAAHLAEAGYTNVSSETREDLDPDKTENSFVNEIRIDGKRTPHEGEEIPFDAAITVTGHYPYVKHDVSLHVDYEANIVFGKYVIDVTVDGEKVGELKNGEEKTLALRLKEGEHELVFAKTGDPSVKGETSFTVEGSRELSCRLKSHTNYIDVTEMDEGGAPVETPVPTETEAPTPTETPTVSGNGL